MVRKQKIKKRKFKAVLMFTATILFLFSLIVFSVQAVEMGEIRSGETKSGNIAIAGQTDSFIFYGEKGQGVVIEMAAIDDDLGPSIYLYRPDGTLETKIVGGNYDNHIRIESHQLEQTGKYTITTAASWAYSTSKIGEYGLSFIKIGGDEDSDEIVENNKIFCEDNQVIFQGKCVEISSLIKKDEEKISKEEYKLIIEKFDILKKEDKEKLEKLAVYLENEIQTYLDKREYEEAKRYTSLLEITYYQLEDENRVYEAKKKYEEIKKEHFLYKLTHPFNDPLEVFSAIFFEFLISSIFIIKKFKKEKISLFRFIIKYWHKFIVALIAFFVILWAVISIVLTMLK